MRLWLWVAFLVISNLLGIEVLKAAVTLPLDEALVRHEARSVTGQSLRLYASRTYWMRLSR